MSVCLTGQPPSHPDAVDTHMNLKAVVDEGNSLLLLERPCLPLLHSQATYATVT